jgi:hypothetical protein
MFSPLQEISRERQRQIDKYGHPHLSREARFIVFMEEVGEIARSLSASYDTAAGVPTDEGNYREELIHAAAVLVAAIEEEDELQETLLCQEPF